MSVLVVGAALVDDLERPARLLAARRTEPPHLAGGWELPGGKVEPGERPEQALHRELAEELGVGIRLGRELPGPVDGAWPLLGGAPGSRRTSALLRVWLAVVERGEPAPLQDHDALRWLGRPDWGSVGWLAVDRPVVAALEELAALQELAARAQDGARNGGRPGAPSDGS